MGREDKNGMRNERLLLLRHDDIKKERQRPVMTTKMQEARTRRLDEGEDQSAEGLRRDASV